MKASHRWLLALCPALPRDPHELAAKFTGAGIEVEGMHAYGAGTEVCVVARVVSMRPHPTKGGLRLVTVDRGGTTQEVVCGAPNVPDPGGLVVLAPLGAHLPAVNMTIEARPIGGVVSEGMLCSETELGLGESASGILILPPGTAAPGTKLTDAAPEVRDTIFEIGLPANRADGLGHIGLAREGAAVCGVPFTAPEPKPPSRLASGTAAQHIAVRIEDGERCPHYGAAVLTGAKVGPSPLWLRYRLSSLGVRSISNAVDVTNLVMLEYGHPTHGFDLRKVRGAQIVVRRATQGEKLRTLDGVDRALSTDDLVICDAEGPTGLGGVMGGGDSEISEATSDILVECAMFDPRIVRRSSRRHALRTEASQRFERGVDFSDTARVLERSCELLSELTGAARVPGLVMTVARELPRSKVTLRHAQLERLLGAAVAKEEARGILERLGFRARAGEADAWDVPPHRPDVVREVDLIDEVARVRGIDRVPATLPSIRSSPDVGGREALSRRVRGVAVSLGLSEALLYAFVAPRALEAVFAEPSPVVLANPLNDHQTVMRTSLLPGLLDALLRARRHGERDVALFATGPVFLPAGTGAQTPAERAPLPEERMMLAVVLAGDRPAHLARPQPVDVWDAKGIAVALVERLLARVPEVVRYDEGGAPRSLHPRGAARIEVGGASVGRLGPLHPDVIDALDLGDGAFVVELDVAALDRLTPPHPRYVPIPRFPASTRDVALVVTDAVPAGEVTRAVRDAAGALAEEVQLFDRFVGGAVPKDHASLAFHVVYRAKDRTLTDAEVDAQHAKVIAAVEQQFGAKLRS